MVRVDSAHADRRPRDGPPPHRCDGGPAGRDCRRRSSTGAVDELHRCDAPPAIV